MLAQMRRKRCLHAACAGQLTCINFILLRDWCQPPTRVHVLVDVLSGTAASANGIYRASRAIYPATRQICQVYRRPCRTVATRRSVQCSLDPSSRSGAGHDGDRLLSCPACINVSEPARHTRCVSPRAQTTSASPRRQPSTPHEIAASAAADRNTPRVYMPTRPSIWYEELLEVKQGICVHEAADMHTRCDGGALLRSHAPAGGCSLCEYARALARGQR